MIRLATRADIDGIVLGYEALFDYEDLHGCFSNWRRGVYPLRSDVEAALEAGTLYVLKEGSTLCASAILNHVQPAEYAGAAWRISAEPDEVLVVHTLCVPPSQSRRGAARRMLRFAAGQARREGCRALRLDTWRGNRPAAQLYASEGFRAIGVAEARNRAPGEAPWTMLLFERDPWEGLPGKRPDCVAGIDFSVAARGVCDCPDTVVVRLGANPAGRSGDPGTLAIGCGDGVVPVRAVDFAGERIGWTEGDEAAVARCDRLFAAGAKRILAFGACDAHEYSGNAALVFGGEARDAGGGDGEGPSSGAIEWLVGFFAERDVPVAPIIGSRCGSDLRGFFAERGAPAAPGCKEAMDRWVGAPAERSPKDDRARVEVTCSALAELARRRGGRFAAFFYPEGDSEARAGSARGPCDAVSPDVRERWSERALSLAARWERRSREAMRANALLERIAGDFRDALGGRLAGFYVHGSLAFGCFRWAASDLDFLAVVDRPLTGDERRALIRALLDRVPEAPPKGMEMSVVTAAAMRDFRHPSPFELHFSPMHIERIVADPDGYCRCAAGIDPDLAAHVAIVREVGWAVVGAPARDAFPPVPRAAVLDSIRRDVQDASAEPLYAALNLCRALAYLEEGRLMSKCLGAVWALERLPEVDRAAVRQALAAYLSGTGIDADALRAFCGRMRDRLRASEEWNGIWTN